MYGESRARGGAGRHKDLEKGVEASQFKDAGGAGGEKIR